MNESQAPYTRKILTRLKAAAGDEIKGTSGGSGFGNEFWQLSKLSRGEEMNAALKEFSTQMKKAGYTGVRFKDDAHPTIAVFDNAFSQAPSTGRPPAVQKILDQIGEKSDAPKGEAYGFRSFYKDFVDKLDPINEAVKKLNKDPESLKVDENPYMLARLANDYKAKTKFTFESGTLDFKTLAKNGESFQEIIKPFSKDVEGFEAYLASKRALEVEGRGLKSGFDVAAASETVKLGAEKYDAAASRLVDFQNRILQYAKDSGRISSQAYNAMVEAGKSYVPFARIIEPEAGGKAGGSSSLKAFKGSDAKIQSPLVSILENTNSLLKIAESNRAGVALVNLAEKSEGQSVIQKVKTPSVPTEVSAEALSKELKRQGIDASEKVLEAFAVFKKQQGPLAENEFAVFRNGKREVWTSDMPGLVDAVKSLNGDVPSANMLLKIARGFTSVKKFTIAITPDFMLKNVFRDQLASGTFTKGGARPFLDILPALGDLIKKNDTYYTWLKSGGAQGSFIDLNTNYLQREIFKLDKSTGFIGSTWNVLKKPVDYLQAAGALAEHATRLAEFKRVSQGETQGSKVFEGGFASREVTVDFSRVGAKISALNAITAFQNISIQGLDRTIRAIKADPVGVGLKATAYITVPSVLLWWANHDDERYKNLPRWQKDLFWIIPTDRWEKATPEQAESLPDYLVRKTSKGEIEINNGAIFRVPKPQELGILFGSTVERVLESFFADNPDAMKDFGSTMQQLVSPAFVPDAISPVMEHWSNKSLFTGNKIVSGAVENVLPAYQYNEYTSETAKQLAKMIRVLPGTSDGKLPLSSPAVVENYVRAWTGNVGAYALQVSDLALAKTGVSPDPVKPRDTLADIPFIKAFVVRYPSSGAQPIQDFYNEYEKHAKYANTITHLRSTGNYQAIEKELQDPEFQDNLVKLSGVNEALRTQAQFARRINKNPEFNSDEQRQMLDGVYYGMIETARLGMDLMREIDKIQKENK